MCEPGLLSYRHIVYKRGASYIHEIVINSYNCEMTNDF